MNHNLEQYYRVPGYNLTLPSRGLYNDYDTSFTNEIEVYPFTTKDEMYLLNPDSLLNGSALEHVIKSCTPSLKEKPGKVLICDIDAILLAAKYATYGDELSLETKCPKCDNQIKFSLSITEMIGGIKYMSEKSILRTENGLEFRLKPLTLEHATTLQLGELQNSATIQEILDTDVSIEKRSMLLRPAMGNLVNSVIDSICYGIEGIYIIKDDILISDFNDIKNFISNIPSKLSTAIQNKQKEFIEYGIPKETVVECKSCGHSFNNKITLDPASFFV